MGRKRAGALTRALAVFGILAATGSCDREPAVPVTPSDATFSASDPRCTFSQRDWGTSRGQITEAFAYTVRRSAARNWIRLDAESRLTWNGKPVDNTGVWQLVNLSNIYAPSPITILAVDRRASCKALRTVITSIEKATPCEPKMCLIGFANIPADPNRGPLVFLPVRP